MQRNIPLLEATMQQIVDHPELHDQGWYFRKDECGTAACFAGWACMLSGYKPVWYMPANEASEVRRPFEYERYTAPDLAARLLGLSFEERKTLFKGTNTRSMLELMVKDLVNGDSLQPAEHYRKETDD